MIVALQTLIFYRESLLNTLERWMRPLYKNLVYLAFNRNLSDCDDDESEDHVYAEYDDEKGVVFFPPVYAQRYAAVTDCLTDERWCGQLEKIVDLGYNDMTYIKYLKEIPGIRKILGVDLECIPSRCSTDLLNCEEFSAKRGAPLEIMLFQGNAADPDYRLIGCDAVVAIELIEHMKPHDLDRLVHTIFGFIKPRVAVITTPNADFNILFKALETNGLRRLDHFFEWTREQFHDWCSNIVMRYPDFTVMCKGIGPGPPDTSQLGCCSQMALFINNSYHKQPELNLNDLTLLSNAPCQNIDELIGVWENSDDLNNFDSSDSLSDIFDHRDSATSFNYCSDEDTVKYSDNSSQCDIEHEQARNYLMFDCDDMCFNVLVPRRKKIDKVYKIEDVASRLNCTTLQVKKFSKHTQNLMAKNKLDALVHTREVVNKIKRLTEILNLKDDTVVNESTHTWNNINWGDNAPYWNQFYTVVKEYNYPFEKKTDDSRILETISDEMNRLIDMHFDDERSVGSNRTRLEVPVQHLMRAVQHITDDTDRVKDLLEWNGYEVAGSVVVHSRLQVGTTSETTREDNWRDDDLFTDVNSDTDKMFYI